jgi:hypothetical protein
MILRRAFTWKLALALGVVLGLGQLVRKSAILAFAAVVLTLLGLIAIEYAPRSRLVLVLAVVTGATAVVAGPWYGYKEATKPPQVAGPQNVPPALTASFFYDVGLPQVLTQPRRPEYVNHVLPMTYSGLWGDYFGIYAWTPPPPPPDSDERQLEAQSALGVVPTALAIAGWLGLLALALQGRHALLPVALLPGIVLAGFIWSTARDLSPDGDVIKPLYMLLATPGWALGFGYGLDRVGRWQWIVVPLLVACALVDLRFLVYGSPLGIL